MLARKCDRCGRLYEAKCIKIDDGGVNSIETRDTDEKGAYWSRKKYDLCPGCLKGLKAWIEMGKED